MACSLPLQLLLLAIGCFRAALAQYCPEGEACVHFPVIHSTNKDVFSFQQKRAVDVQLANRSDIAYYAQRKIKTHVLALSQGSKATDAEDSEHWDASPAGLCPAGYRLF